METLTMEEAAAALQQTIGKVYTETQARTAEMDSPTDIRDAYRQVGQAIKEIVNLHDEEVVEAAGLTGYIERDW